MLNTGEKKLRKPHGISAAGTIVSFEIAPKLKLGWKSEVGELTELESLLEDIAAEIEGEDKTENPTGDIVIMGKNVKN